MTALRQKNLKQKNYLGISATVLAVALISACGGGGSSSSSSQETTINTPVVQQAVLTGKVSGAKQNVAGATLMVFAASGTSVGVPKLLGSTVTGADGKFSISAWSNPPVTGDLIYVVSVGGNASGGVNSNLSLLSIAGTAGSAVTSIQLNEYTTVAALTKLGNSMGVAPCSDLGVTNTFNATCPVISGQSSGWSSAVSAVNSLVDSTSGNPVATLNSGNLQNLNMQASVLAACAATTGGSLGDQSSCGKLFALPDFLTLVANPIDIGAGASAIGSTPDGKFVFITNDRNNTISVYSQSGGKLSSFNGSSLKTGNLPSGVAVTPDGKYVLVSNYSDATISVFSHSNGVLTAIGSPVATGKGPTEIVISNDGNNVFTANYSGMSVSAFTFSNGVLASAGPDISTNGITQHIAISPDNQFVYASTYSSSALISYANQNARLKQVQQTYTSFNIGGLSIAPDGKTLVAPDYGGNAISFGLNSGAFNQSNIVKTTSFGSSVSVITADGKYAFISGSDTGIITPLSLQNGNLNLVGSPVSAGLGIGKLMILKNSPVLLTINSSKGSMTSYRFATSDTVSSLLNLQSVPAAAAAQRVFGALPANPVFTPVPTTSPASLSL